MFVGQRRMRIFNLRIAGYSMRLWMGANGIRSGGRTISRSCDFSRRRVFAIVSSPQVDMAYTNGPID